MSGTNTKMTIETIENAAPEALAAGAGIGPGSLVARGGQGPEAPRWDLQGRHGRRGPLKNMEIQFAENLSIPAKVEIHRQHNSVKVTITHLHGGARAPPINEKIGRSQMTQFNMLNPMVHAPRAAKFIQAISAQKPKSAP